MKIEKFGGRFFTDYRRAFSLGVPVPPGPLPMKPTALMLGKQVPLHDQKDNLYQYLALADSHSPLAVINKLLAKGKGKKDNNGKLPNID